MLRSLQGSFWNQHREHYLLRFAMQFCRSTPIPALKSAGCRQQPEPIGCGWTQAAARYTVLRATVPLLPSKSVDVSLPMRAKSELMCEDTVWRSIRSEN